MFKGLMLCALGVASLILCGAAFIAWWGLCFGSIIVGLVLLFLAPRILLLPLPIGIFGLAMIGLGMESLGRRNEPTRLEAYRDTAKLETDAAYKQRMAEINQQRKLQGLEEVQITTSRELSPAAKEALKKISR